MIDLHMHTLHSDGTLTSAELLALVRNSRVAAFSVTDHDTLAGYRGVHSLMQDGDPELIPGVELSVSVENDDVHMLAYLFEPEHQEFNAALAEFQQKRFRRGEMMIERLQGLGVDISFAAVQETAGNAVIGRPHVAETLLRLGAVRNYQDAFDRYIRKDAPAYVAKAFFEPAEAIQLVHRAGGLAVMAHPMIDDMLRHLETLTEMGLDGIEVWHSKHTPSDVERLTKLANKYGLVPSGGSDFHGREGRHGQIGSQPVPVEILDQMRQQAHKRRSHH